MSIADIATGNGTEIDKHYLKGVRQSGRTRAADWPTQGQPNKQDWNGWRRVLPLALGCGNKYALKTKLGAWLEPYASKALPHWHWFWYTHNNNLYNKIHSHWELYKGRMRRNKRQGPNVYDTKTRIPAHLMTSY